MGELADRRANSPKTRERCLTRASGFTLVLVAWANRAKRELCLVRSTGPPDPFELRLDARIEVDLTKRVGPRELALCKEGT